MLHGSMSLWLQSSNMPNLGALFFQHGLQRWFLEYIIHSPHTPPWYWFLLLPFQLYCRLKLKQTYPTIGDVAWNEQWFDFFDTYLALTMRTSQSMKSREWSNQSNYSRNQSCEFSSLSFRMQSLVVQSNMRNVKAVTDGIDKHFRANEIIMESLGNVFGSTLGFVWNQLHLLFQGHETISVTIWRMHALWPIEEFPSKEKNMRQLSEALVEISWGGRNVALLMPAIDFQNHDEYRGDEFQ